MMTYLPVGGFGFDTGGAALIAPWVWMSPPGTFTAVVSIWRLTITSPLETGLLSFAICLGLPLKIIETEYE